jgi:hypothetical protein
MGGCGWWRATCGDRLSGQGGSGREPSEAGHVVTRLARRSFVVARARPTKFSSRHFWAAKTCSIVTRTRTWLALPRARCDGIALPHGFGRWRCGTSPHRASSATLAFEMALAAERRHDETRSRSVP